MDRSGRELTASRALLIPYLAGSLSAAVMFLMIFLFVGYRIGFSNLVEKLWGVMAPTRASKSNLYLPGEIRNELTGLNAVVDNADNPTNQREHDTILVQPDEQLGWVLRPGVRISGLMLRSQNALNWDPPVLYLRSDAVVSDALRSYLDKQVRLNYTYSVDAEGFRTTVPMVKSERRILMVGDSVPFGVGVNDNSTIASNLQRMVGESFRVVNGGVGSYEGDQVFQVADKLAQKGNYDALIYVASQNDFMVQQGVTYSAQAKEVVKKVSSLKHKFSGRVIVMLHTYMEYSIRDVLLEKGWPREMIDGTDVLRRDLSAMAGELGFEYVDWDDIVGDYMKQSESIFSRFGLYVDHAHLSPLGSRLAADKLYGSLRNLKLTP